MTALAPLPASGRVAAPWKNGGGVTRTVAAFPDDAGPDAFVWRVSIAEVRAAGPFSAFPDTDRHLSVLKGTLLLEVNGRPYTLSASSDGLAFPGDVPAIATPVGGPVRNLNVMTRRGRASAEVTLLRPGTSATIGAEVALLVATGAARVECGDGRARLGPLDALRVVDGIGRRLSVEAAGPVHQLQILLAPGTAQPH